VKTLDDAEEYELWGYPDTTVADCDFLEKAFETYGCNVYTVLDIACGTGRHAIEMAGRGYAVTGLDVSESMIRKSREKAGSLEIEFVEEDMLNLSHEDSYDAAYFLFNTVSLVTENDEIITLMKAVHRALRKDGLFLVELGNLWGLVADNSFHNGTSRNTQERDGYRRKYTSKVVIGPNNGVCTQTRDIQYWKDAETLEPKRRLVKQRVYSINEFELLARLTGYELLAVYGSLDINKANPEPFKIIDDPNRVYETKDHYRNFTLIFQRLEL
jgi:SAM-dependent methyltransferase